MTGLEAWKKAEKRLVQLGWELDLDTKMWKNSGKIIIFADKTDIQMMGPDIAGFELSAKEFALLANWVETYWELNYRK